MYTYTYTHTCVCMYINTPKSTVLQFKLKKKKNNPNSSSCRRQQVQKEQAVGMEEVLKKVKLVSMQRSALRIPPKLGIPRPWTCHHKVLLKSRQNPESNWSSECRDQIHEAQLSTVQTSCPPSLCPSHNRKQAQNTLHRLHDTLQNI